LKVVLNNNTTHKLHQSETIKNAQDCFVLLFVPHSTWARAFSWYFVALERVYIVAGKAHS